MHTELTGATPLTARSRELLETIALGRASRRLAKTVSTLIAQGADPYTPHPSAVGITTVSALEMAVHRLMTARGRSDSWIALLAAIASAAPRRAPLQGRGLIDHAPTSRNWSAHESWVRVSAIRCLAPHWSPDAPQVRDLVAGIVRRHLVVGVPSTLPIEDIALSISPIFDAASRRRFWLEPFRWRAWLTFVSGSLVEARVGQALMAIRDEVDSATSTSAPNLLRWLGSNDVALSDESGREAGDRCRALFSLLLYRLACDGVDVTSPSPYGLRDWSPLHVAAAFGAPPVFDALLGAGANPDLSGPGGVTPAEIAQSRPWIASSLARWRAARAREELSAALASRRVSGACAPGEVAR